MRDTKGGELRPATWDEALDRTVAGFAAAKAAHAAKLGADMFADALSGLGADAAANPDQAIIAGLIPPDDAAAYRISDELAIIGTLDFFPLLVGDPRTFGEI